MRLIFFLILTWGLLLPTWGLPIPTGGLQPSTWGMPVAASGVLIPAQSARAQSVVSGRLLLEPMIGRFFGEDGSSVTLYGFRGTLRESYARSYYARALHGANEERRFQTFGDGTTLTSNVKARQTLIVLGTGSTLVDRDVTGWVGGHVLLGFGLLASFHQEVSTWDFPNEPPSREEFEETETFAVADFSILSEIELGSPRLLLRGDLSGYLGAELNRDEFEGLLQIPGATVTIGLAVSL